MDVKNHNCHLEGLVACVQEVYASWFRWSTLQSRSDTVTGSGREERFVTFASYKHWTERLRHRPVSGTCFACSVLPWWYISSIPAWPPEPASAECGGANDNESVSRSCVSLHKPVWLLKSAQFTKQICNYYLFKIWNVETGEDLGGLLFHVTNEETEPHSGG